MASEETLNVPFVISNPHLFKHCRGEQTDSLVSLIDLLPTLANLAGVPDLDRWVFKGKDLSPILSNPRAEVQNHIHFTYEDLYFFVPSRITCGRSSRSAGSTRSITTSTPTRRSSTRCTTWRCPATCGRWRTWGTPTSRSPTRSPPSASACTRS